MAGEYSWEEWREYVDTANLAETLKDYYTKDEVEEILSHYYTSEEVDDILANYYTKDEIDENIYTKDQVEEILTNYYTKGEIDTTLEDYYTKEETDDKFYDKEYIDENVYTQTDTDEKFVSKEQLAFALDGYYNKDEIDYKFRQADDKLTEATEEINGKIDEVNEHLTTVDGQITAIEENIDNVESDLSAVTERVTDLENRADATDQSITEINNKFSDYYTKTEVDSIESKLKEDINTVSQAVTDLGDNLANNYYTKTEVDTAITTATDDMATNASVDEKLENYYTKTEVDTAVAEATEDMATNAGVDEKLNGYYTKEETDSAISTATDDMATNASVDTKLEDYYTKTEVDQQITDAVASVDHSTFVTNEALDEKLDGYYTKDEVDQSIQTAVEGVDLSNYYTKDETYTKTEVDALIPSLDGYVTDTALNDTLADYATTEQVTQAIADATENTVTTSDLEEKLQDYATSEDLSEAVSEAVGDIDLSNYVTIDGTQVITGTKTFMGGVVTTDVVNMSASPAVYVPVTPTLNDHAASKQYVDTMVANVAAGGEVDLSNYYTKTETDEAISTATDDMATNTSVTAKLSDYYTKSETDALIPDTDDFVTVSDVQTITGTKTFTGALNATNNVDFSSSTGVYVPTPTADSQAANKQYVDDAISAVEEGVTPDLSNCVLLTGNQSIRGYKTFVDDTRFENNVHFDGPNNAIIVEGSGKVVLDSAESVTIPEPSADNEAATKKYVDDAVSNISTTGNYLPLSGGTMTGAITLADMSSALAYIKTEVGNGIRVLNQNSGAGIHISNSSTGEAIGIDVTSGASGTGIRILSADSTTPLIFTQGGYVNLQNSAYVTVPTPTASMHATTKTYVDEAITSAVNDALDRTVADMSNVDLNTYTTTGDYFVSSSSSLTNAPSVNSSSALQNVFLNVVAYNTSNLTQTLTCVPSNNSNTVYRYVRLCAGGTWKDWQQVAPPAVDSSTSTGTSNLKVTRTFTNIQYDLDDFIVDNVGEVGVWIGQQATGDTYKYQNLPSAIAESELSFTLTTTKSEYGTNGYTNDGICYQYLDTFLENGTHGRYGRMKKDGSWTEWNLDGIDVTKYVTTDTVQTITGTKTFDGYVYCNADVSNATGRVLTTKSYVDSN